VTRVVLLQGQGFPVEVLHRLALAVEPRDGFTGGPAGPPVRVGREVPRPPSRPAGRGPRPRDPLDHRLDLALETNGATTYKLRHRLDLPEPPQDGQPSPVLEVVLRLVDPTRRYVTRRLRLPVWTRRRVEEAEVDPPGPYVPAASRLVRPWLLPGAAYTPPGGTTGVRGRVQLAGRPMPWPRLVALGPGGAVVGRAHGDERGEFLLLITGTGAMPPPPPSTLPVRLAMWGPDPAAPAPPGQQLNDQDPLHDLVIEDAVRRTLGSVPGTVDEQVLRGETVPRSYRPAANRPTLTLTVGEMVQPAPFPFA
jgi:hypothetical protein